MRYWKSKLGFWTVASVTFPVALYRHTSALAKLGRNTPTQRTLDEEQAIVTVSRLAGFDSKIGTKYVPSAGFEYFLCGRRLGGLDPTDAWLDYSARGGEIASGRGR
jgi:hypothetical protein